MLVIRGTGIGANALVETVLDRIRSFRKGLGGRSGGILSGRPWNTDFGVKNCTVGGILESSGRG